MAQKKKETFKYCFRTVCNIFITLYMVAIFFVIWENSLNELLGRQFMNKGNLLMCAVYLALTIIYMFAFNGYKIGINKISVAILSQILASLLVNFTEIFITILMVARVDCIGKIIENYAFVFMCHCVGLFFVTWFFMRLYFHIVAPYKMLVVNGEHSNNLKLKMQDRPDKYEVAAEISYKEPIEKIHEELKKYDALLLNDIPSELKNELLKICFEEKKRVYFTPKISDIIVKGADELNIFDTPLYLCRNLELSLPQRIIKRLGDIVVSLIGIIVTSPIMLITAITIRLYDGGPALYKQTRCTIGGKEFEILKFRSMITDAEKDGKARLATENDNRITPIGKFIRATRIDELPQLINILMGDMSLVGPRPERPEICQQYINEIPEFGYRLRVKAGLTGYAQVYGKYNTTSYDKLKLDLIYVQKCSLALDIQLILLTMRVIFTKEATEGLEDGKTTASTMK